MIGIALGILATLIAIYVAALAILEHIESIETLLRNMFKDDK